jgi:hypothetical protein
MSMPQAAWPLIETERRFGQTSRRDAWWVQPLITFIPLAAFLVYANWAAWQGNHYEVGPYLSPFYSPLLFGDSHHAWFGPKPGWWPGAVPFSAALLILWIPGGFRITCYYYRGAYYKAFWADPPSCTVGEPRKRYLGEHAFPLILQNVHRYFMYLGLIFLFILAYDVWKAFWFTDPATGAVTMGMGVGTLLLATNVGLLASYTFGCHSLRHLIGGGRDEISKSPLCAIGYACASSFNSRHMLFAWLSLFSVALSDIYVRLCSMGVWNDFRLF